MSAVAVPDRAAVPAHTRPRAVAWPAVLAPTLILLAGAGLRLFRLQWAQYRRDDAIVLGLAQQALTSHHIPTVGMISTLGIDNGPAQVWLTALGLLAGPSPFAAEWVVALFNILGIAAAYSFAREAFGRRVGLLTALLLAVSAWSVLYSRRLWGNDMLAPFTALTLWSLACVLRRGDRRHQVLVWVWAAMLAQVYVVGLAQLPAVALGLLGAAVPRRLRLAPTLLGAALFLLLTLPYVLGTVLPELGHVQRLAGGKATLDATSLRQLAQTVGVDAYQFYLPQLAKTLDAHRGLLGAASALAAVLLAAGAVLAIAGIVSGKRGARLGREEAPAPPILGGLTRAAAPWLDGAAAGVEGGPSAVSVPAMGDRPSSGPPELGARGPLQRSATRWLLALTLIWAALPVAATARHAVDLFPHYLLGAVPATYTLMALALGALLAWRPAAWAGALLTGALVAAQLGAAALFFAAVPNYVRGAEYGVPLYDVQRLAERTQQAVRTSGANGVLVIGHYDGAEMGEALRTWLPNVTVIDDQGSLRLPAADERLVLVTTRDDSPLVRFLRTLGAGETLHFQGDDTIFRIYSVTTGQLRAAAAAALPTTTPRTFGGDVTLQGSALPARAPAGGTLLWSARWTVTAQGAREQPIASVFAHVLGSGDAKAAAHDGAFDNDADRWQPGDEILTWVAVPIPADAAVGSDRVVVGLYRLGAGGAINPLAGPTGPDLALGAVQITPAQQAASGAAAQAGP